MKRMSILFILAVMLVGVVPIRAQDAETCSVDDIKNQMNEFMADYLSAQVKADTADDALTAANNFQASIAELTAGCADVGGTAEATSEAVDNRLPSEGRYMLNWSNTNERFCPDPNYVTKSSNRPIFVKVENGTILFEDLYVWPVLTFNKDIDGNYFYRRNTTGSDGSAISFEYTISSIEPDQIEGVSTVFYQAVDCTLANEFKIVLVDENILCIAGAESAVNLRSGPGTTFDRFGTLNAREIADVVGYSTGADGFKWWKLSNDAWVRDDLVLEAGRCDDVPEISG